VQQPALYGLAAAGLATALWTRRVPRGMWPLVAGALSFVAGLFALGSTYDQYYVLFLPLFAVVGAAWMQPRLRRTDWAIVAMVLPAAHSIAYHVRWVTSHTAPSDSYLGGSPTPPSFDPTPGSTSS
jgi:hypothetical protein